MKIILRAKVVQKIIKRVPYVEPIIQGMGLALDTKEIMETSTSLGASIMILDRFIEQCSTS